MGAQLNEVQELETRVTNVFSVDVEDYFHVEAFSDIVPRERWDSYPLRVEDNTRRILDLLDDQEVEATFFVLGWVAEKRPALVREIADRGHEIACHSYWHRLIYKLTPQEFGWIPGTELFDHAVVAVGARRPRRRRLRVRLEHLPDSPRRLRHS
jgi:peptidoglycan/xylan/chitin deacetylase (PgdA/CDA1 family)